MRKYKYEVTVEIPDDYDVKEVREYMREAISQWSGQFHPDDSLFGWFWGGTNRLRIALKGWVK